MVARFFIDRPVLAWVISIVIVLLGGIAAGLLPIAEYPEITPPTVQVTARYPGANAQVIADTVAGPIEQQVVGVEHMLYMSSQSNNDGSYTLDVTFKLGTDVNMAQVLVQNRVAIAEPTLPEAVRTIGVTVKRRSPDLLLVFALRSEDDPQTGRPYYDQLYMSNYATIQLKDALARVEGVGDVVVFGARDYSMRVWLDPDKLQSRNLTAGDVIRVLRAQNVQVAAGQIGQPPVPRGQDLQYTMSTLGRLVEADQFADIILKTGTDGEVTYLKDVARTELGARNQDVFVRLDGKPSVGVGIFQLPGSNALDVGDGVKAKMRELETRFPKGLHYVVINDITPFIRASVHEVFITLRAAVLLVAVVVLLFLQSWKALLLPVIDVAVSLVGTCAIMLLLGFSLNNLTLFGLVLAIGIVVDDAIVVLENIERWLEKGLPVREATIQAMHEITGPILAITLVLSSVLLPSAFLGGITGQFFRQFALTISASMILSAINAMTMTPARAAAVFAGRQPGEHGDQGKEALPWWSFALFGGLASVWLLAPTLGPWLGLPAGGEGGEATPGGLQATVLTWGISCVLFLPGAVAGGALGWCLIRPVNWALGRFFRGFNWVFDRTTHAYGKTVAWCLRLSTVVLLVYVGLIGLTGFGFTRVPSGFVPSQDKGLLVANVQLPDSASLERTLEVTAALEKIALETPGVAHTAGFSGQSFVLNAISSNYGTLFVILAPFEERRDPTRSAEAITAQLRARFQREIPEARVLVFGRPAVPGLGNAGGFKLMVEATGDVNFDGLQAQADTLAATGNQQPGLVGLFNGFRARTPQLYVDIDRIKVRTMGVELTDVFDTLQVYLGGYYVNDFNRFGRTWQVNVQADAPFRVDAETVRQLKVRNADGAMVPLGAVASVRDAAGPVQITRYNLFPAAAINGASLPGVSTGAVLATMEKLARELPRSMRSEWTELSYLQKQESKVESFRDLQQNPFSAFVLGAVLVFLVLAGLYGNWSLPLAVILVVPMCLLSALAGVALAGMDVNIFVQVGFVVLVGLACKNAILIVEFARDRQAEGASRYEAAVEAARLRLRPILMTSFAFILGVFPLVIAQGAGAEMRRTLGTAVFSGMVGVTFFGLFFTPVFYVVLRWFVERRRTQPTPRLTPVGTVGAMIVVPCLLGLLSGCMVGPDYQRPQTQVPTAFANQTQEGLSTETVETAWWRGFQDDRLQQLVALTLAHNHDVRVATARLREARALLSETTFDRSPTVTSQGAYTRERTSKDQTLPGADRDLELYDVGFDARWELDVFGRVRRSIEAGTADVEAAEASRRDVIVSLLAEVARNYFELRGTQHRLAVARQNAENQRQTLELTNALLESGRGTELDTARAAAQFQSTLASIPPLETAIKAAMYRLGVLIGQPPTALEPALAAPQPLPPLPRRVALGRPEDLLRRRPDIRVTERNLAAAMARVGVATADLFPRITLFGSVALQATSLTGLFKGGSDTFAIGPNIFWAAFDLGRVRARIRAADARTEAALAQYEQRVLLALEDTENALVTFTRQQARREALWAAAQASEKAQNLARERYQSGAADFLTVLDAERTLLAAQDQLADSATRTVTALVAVYKALGGGWDIASERAYAQAP